MTRTCLNWSLTLSLFALVAACSGGKSAGAGDNTYNNLGGNSPYPLGGAGALGGKGNAGGNGFNSDVGGAGNPGDTSNGGSGNNASLGGAGNGGETQLDTSSGVGGSFDIRVTGGTGNSNDIGQGGGSSLDVGTGGGLSIDVATGGGNSVDLGTGGGNSVDLGTGGGNSVDLGTGGGSSIDLGCVETALTDINVYATIDATPSGADTEGNMYVGGNLSATGSYTVGMKNVTGCDSYALVVGGNISIPGGGTVNGGKATYAGTTASASAVQFKCGLSRGLPPGLDFAALKSTVENLSTGLSKLTPNCTVKTGSGNKIILTGTDPKLNVCSIDSTQLGNIDVNFPAGSSVVVNVSGKTPNWSGAAVCLNGECADSDQATYVLWNFYEATNLAASGIAIEGSVLAPFATLDGSGGHIAGQVIVQYLKGGLEYHPYYFKGCIKWPSAV